ncbi:pyocin activator PrtN family protein [Pseudomonas sp. o96-267]|uniref:pyocin activator PrtN family protein n=1 Tax=Pseudomonas sp. o96-267 TaxID=2479853 RepID=UPI0013153F5F|nr:pyocin activator PrtN family protein [Pseudomonas sp. o96-267]
MKTTLQLLQERWKVNSLPLYVVRRKYLKSIETEKHLRELIRSGAIQLPTFKLYDSRRAPLHVRLADLAAYLDARAEQAA